MVTILSKENSILGTFVSQLRDVKIQKDRLRFKRNLERIGEVMAYEISKTFSYKKIDTETPLGIAECKVPDCKVVLATILRAGLPLHQGMLNYFDDAGCAFISAHRLHHKDGTFEIKVESISCPNIDNKIVILCDPMLATGASIKVAVEGMLAFGRPKAIHIAAVIGSAYGLTYLERLLPYAHVWLADLDEELTAKSYIVPGLGDAGDLSYGEKVSLE
ncbi:MAG: uracil phosphoribosyltransferase [Saprospiraceae bacterium]|nr:uracil phosphoribosyltransferase [Saprospiraceae bacterium]